MALFATLKAPHFGHQLRLRTTSAFDIEAVELRKLLLRELWFLALEDFLTLGLRCKRTLFRLELLGLDNDLLVAARPRCRQSFAAVPLHGTKRK